MTGTDHASRSGQLSLDHAPLAVGSRDVLLCLIFFAVSLAVLVFAISPLASFQSVIPLHVASLALPGAFFALRRRRDGDLTVAALLLITGFACGPLGGLGCAIMALTLSRRGSAPARLRHWYEYIAGIVARERIVRVYDELSSGRMPPDAASEVPRFRPILHGASTEEQQLSLIHI